MGARVEENEGEHISERFGRLLDLYRKPDGSVWGGQDLQDATGGTVSRSYVTNLKKGRVENPGFAKLEAIAGAMGFPPTLWFGERGGGEAALNEALVAALADETNRAILEEAMRLGVRERRLLLGIAREIAGRPELS